MSIYGCNTFFPLQNSGVHTYTNAGKSSYNAMTISLRRTVTHGWGYDFNYTLSHAIDNGSGSESASAPAARAASQTCRMRSHPARAWGQRITTPGNQSPRTAVVELPVGKGKALFNNVPNWLDEAIGGWQVSTLFTFRTGQSLNCTSTTIYNTNYDNTAYCILAPGVAFGPRQHGFTFDQTASRAFRAIPTSGRTSCPAMRAKSETRGIIRGLDVLG